MIRLRIGRIAAYGKIDGLSGNAQRNKDAFSELKNQLMSGSYRVALLETADGRPFFLAPVGIDEGNSVYDKWNDKRRRRAFQRLVLK